MVRPRLTIVRPLIGWPRYAVAPRGRTMVASSVGSRHGIRLISRVSVHPLKADSQHEGDGTCRRKDLNPG
jgi:hypothetical protein